MRRMASVVASLLLLASGQAVADQGAMETFCKAEWGLSEPMVQSCIASQQAASVQLERLLSDAARLGWREEVERTCGVAETKNYGAAADCVAVAINGGIWEPRDRELALADAWQKPGNVPEPVFLEAKAQCIRDFGLRFSTVEICIDHSTREFRQ